MYGMERLARAAQARVDSASARSAIANTMQKVREGRPLAAEPDPIRLKARLMAKAGFTAVEAETMARSLKRPPPKRPGAEVVQGDTLDFVGVAFLELGLQAAKAVARVRTPEGLGTGFMVSEDLFVTNNHVIPTADVAAQSIVEFAVEYDVLGQQKRPTSFRLAPERFFMTDDVAGLDFTLVAVGERSAGAGSLRDFGYCALSKAKDKHALGESANIIQHPQGRLKEIVLRENRLAHRDTDILHYLADTEPGSSGSPVFNNEWQVIALHHWGGPSRDLTDEQGRPVPQNVNEGIRASAIMAAIEARATMLDAARQTLLIRARDLHLLERALLTETVAPVQAAATVSMKEDGSATWRIPIEISVRLPGMTGDARQSQPMVAPAQAPTPPDAEAAERKVVPDPDYSNRAGYRPDFINGFELPLPKLSDQLERDAAKLKDVRRGANPFELKYHHFSVAMNAERKLAFFTACNIDGRAAKDINRKTGAVTPARPGGGEALESSSGGEEWFIDPRIEENSQTPQPLYDRQTTRLDDGTIAKKTDHLNRIFQRGHLVRRKDPAWGSDGRAIDADADTFHFSNCTPQVGFFNMGSAPRVMPNSGGGQLWRALEDYVLDNAVDDRLRVSVFTGPVFGAGDPPWRNDVVAGFRIPLQFWKIVVWTEMGRLRATAMIASQLPFLAKRMPELLGPGGAFRPEGFGDTADVGDFLASVAHVEELTGLDFGQAIRDADTFVPEGGGEALGPAIRRVRDMREVFRQRTRGELREAMVAPAAEAAPRDEPLLVEVHYATDRQPTGEEDPNEFYGNEPGEELRYGKLKVSVPGGHLIGDIERPSLWRLEFSEDPARHIVLTSVEPMREESFFASLHSAVEAVPDKSAFVFIHGFNVTFAEASYRAAQMAVDLFLIGEQQGRHGLACAPVLYSWPSIGKVVAYTVDGTSANSSAIKLKGFLRNLAGRSGAKTIVVVAHSMGNQALIAALRDIGNGMQADEHPLIREIVLAAPDYDKATFLQVADAVKKTCRRITLYASSADQALRLSKKINGFPRLGDSDGGIFIGKDIDSIDATAAGDDILQHSAFGEPAVLRDIYALATGIVPPKDRGLVPRTQIAPQGDYWAIEV